MREGDCSSDFFLLLHGHARVEAGADNRESIAQVRQLSPGDFFGEMSLFLGEPRKATVVALEHSECMLINKASMTSILAKRQDLARQIIDVIAHRLEQLEDAKRAQDTGQRGHMASIIWKRFKEFFDL